AMSAMSVRRTRATVPDLPEIIRARYTNRGGMGCLRNLVRGGRDIEEHPVREITFGGIRIMHDESKAACAVWFICPSAGWGSIASIAGEFDGDRISVRKSIAAQCEGHCSLLIKTRWGTSLR